MRNPLTSFASVVRGVETLATALSDIVRSIDQIRALERHHALWTVENCILRATAGHGTEWGLVLRVPIRRPTMEEIERLQRAEMSTSQSSALCRCYHETQDHGAGNCSLCDCEHFEQLTP